LTLKKQNLETNKENVPSKNKSNRSVIIASVIIVVLIIGAAIGISAVQKSGYSLRNTAGVESKNLSVDNAMLSYYMYNKMYKLYEANPDLYQERGFDIEQPLKKQMFDETMTWYDYSMEFTVKDAIITLTFAEKAYEDGVGLTDYDLKVIERDINNLRKEAEEAGMNMTDYLRSRYGEGIVEDDVRRAMELSAIAEKEKVALMDSYEYDEETVKEYYQNYRQQFIKTDVIFFSVIPYTVDVEDATSSEITEARQEAKDKAQELINCSSAEEFMDNLKEYIFANYDDETAQKKYDKVYHEDYTYVSDNKMSSWLFSETREDGDSTVIKFNDDQYTAVYVVSAAKEDLDISKNIRDIYLDDLNYSSREEAVKKAQEILSQFAGGDEEAFAELAKTYSDNARYKNNGGLIANVEKNSDEAYIEWLFDASRKAGDTEIIEDENGVHIVYFVGDGNVGWMNDVIQVLKNTDYETAYEEMLESVDIVETPSKYYQVKERS